MPTIYSGELLYSFLARLILYNGWDNTVFSSIIHGDPSIKRPFISAILPRRIEFISKIFDGHIVGSPDYILHNHTLFPYYSAYFSRDVKERWRSNLMEICHFNLRHSSNQFKNLNPGSLRLKFCNVCNLQTLAEYGECFWRRDHQLPLVDVCPEHKTLLRVSAVGSRNIQKYVAATIEICPPSGDYALKISQENDIDALHEVALRSQSLLLRASAISNMSDIREERRQELKQIGHAFLGGKLKGQRLHEAAEYHLDAIAKYYPCLKTRNRDNDWIRELFHRRNIPPHPMYQVMFEYLVDKIKVCDIERVFVKEMPFGVGPWACGNNLTCSSTVSDVEICQTTYNKGKYRGVFKCICGFEYTMVTRGDGVNSKPRFRATGGSLEIYLQEDYIRNRKTTQEKILSKVALTKMTLLKLLKQLRSKMIEPVPA